MEQLFPYSKAEHLLAQPLINHSCYSRAPDSRVLRAITTSCLGTSSRTYEKVGSRQLQHHTRSTTTDCVSSQQASSCASLSMSGNSGGLQLAVPVVVFLIRKQRCCHCSACYRISQGYRGPASCGKSAVIRNMNTGVRKEH
jgi:hypothetical protein